MKLKNWQGASDFNGLQKKLFGKEVGFQDENVGMLVKILANIVR